MTTITEQNSRALLQHLLSNSDEKPKDYLLNPIIDVLMVGGLSIIFFIGMNIFIPPGSDSNKLGWVMFYLSFVINFPHFMSTYVLLYKDYRTEIFRNWRFTWAAIVSPVLLGLGIIGLATYSVSINNARYMGYLVNLMYFLVGHHYVKQIYGCVIVSSAKKKFYFNKLESRFLWLSMYSIWMASYVSSNGYVASSQNFYGIYYTTLDFNASWINASIAFTAISALLFLYIMVKRYIDDGKVIPLTAWVAFLSIYVWYIPTFHHQHFYLMIPFFHSLQYLLFTTAFTINKATEESKIHNEGPLQRSAFIKKMSVFFVIIFVTGYLVWDTIPKYLDTMSVYPILGTTIFMFGFQIFLNIHHYIVDNVIWRSDNQQMKKYL